MTFDRRFLSGAAILCTAAFLLAGCSSAEVPEEEVEEIVLAEETLAPTEAYEAVMALSPEGPILPSIEDVEADYSEPIPDYLRLGMQHPIVARLQERLMQLGFMDDDEPTDNYGEVTQSAVKVYQRQNKLAQDGIVGLDTLQAIFSPEAKYYAAQNGDSGDDIERIQSRLYELGYLARADEVTGYYGDTTEQAVIKLQEINDLEQDGKVGRSTLNLLYSEDVKANMLAFGEESEIVLEAQKRLRDLGYMTTEPDGKYGNDTVVAVKQFQSKNDQVVDGYLGPSTRIALNSSDAVPNGMSIGDSGEAIERMQDLLASLGYMSTANTTGYFGEATQNAVKLFQETNKLTVDGIAGAQTMTLLSSGDAKRAPARSSTGSSSGSSSSGSSSSGSSSGSSSSRSSSSGGSSSATPNTGSASGSVSALLSVAESKLGCRYVYGAKGPNTFDCSGFVYWCLNQVGVNQSYLTSSGWRNVGKYTRINNYSDLRAGDIIVENGHVGIVAEGGTVIDASSSNGRVVHRSLSSWWANSFICGWRIF